MTEREWLPFGAVLDACVLIPMALCDTLLRAADAGLYRLYWSEDILAEVRRNLVEKRLTTEQGARNRVAMMERAFAEASVTGYQAIVGRMTNDAKDRHVLAVAVTADAQVIVTRNLRDFPDSALNPYGIETQTPDAFLLNLYERFPGSMIDVLRDQANALKNPPLTMVDLLDGLAGHVPLFTDAIKSLLDE